MNTFDLLLFVRGEIRGSYQVIRFDSRGMSMGGLESPAGAFDRVLRERPDAVAVCTQPGDGGLELIHSLIRKVQIPVVSLVGGRGVGVRWGGEGFDPFVAYEAAMRLILSMADGKETAAPVPEAKVA